MKKFFIVTPAFNSEKTILCTLHSVLQQSMASEVFYHVQDGGSTDNTIQILKNFAQETLQHTNFRFSFTSEPDAGIYDALLKGFSSFDGITDDDWCAWINSDDYFEPDAFLHVSNVAIKHPQVRWLTGRSSVKDYDGTVNIAASCIHNAFILGAGIADGLNWYYLQQEGTFFTYNLWQQCALKAFAGLRYAGDWHLWVLMAKITELYCLDTPLGTFCRSHTQVSQVQLLAYQAEISSVISLERREYFFNINENDERLIANQIDFKHYTVKKTLLNDFYKQRRFLFTKRQKTYLSTKNNLKRSNNLVYFDTDWQYPAITEKHAFDKIKGINLPTSCCYVGFPWATLIDLKNNGKEASYIFERLVEEIKCYTRDYKTVITVCQHVLFSKFKLYFVKAGITDVFWSHCTKDLAVIKQGVAIHPFPLFPLQRANAKFLQRDILFSFIGASTVIHDKIDARELIFTHLSEVASGFIKRTDAWFLNDLVYSRQINGIKSEFAENIEDISYRMMLEKSLFVLCPAGSGPNSIRLWEVIGAGAIPVIISDELLLPGDIKVWQQAAVFCAENEQAIKDLPKRLAELSAKKINIIRMQANLMRLWNQYGPDNFVYDIEAFLTDKNS